MRPRQRQMDLIAFVSVLAMGLGLVLVGVRPEGVATLTVGLSGLYSTWAGVRRRPEKPPNREGER
jgi:hypothetical protein